jgi:hypothetical protein
VASPPKEKSPKKKTPSKKPSAVKEEVPKPALGLGDIVSPFKAENPVFVVVKKTPKKSMIVKDKDKCYDPKSGTKDRVRKKKPVKEQIERVDFASLIQGAAGKLSGQKNEATTKESSSAHKETPVKDEVINESTPPEVDYNGQSTIFDVIREAQERPKSPY